jgi:hypothetical protein
MILSLLLLACTEEAADRGLSVPPADDAEVGGSAPDFTMPGHDGQPIRLSDHAGDVILLSLSGFT